MGCTGAATYAVKPKLDVVVHTNGYQPAMERHSSISTFLNFSIGTLFQPWLLMWWSQKLVQKFILMVTCQQHKDIIQWWARVGIEIGSLVVHDRSEWWSPYRNSFPASVDFLHILYDIFDLLHTSHHLPNPLVHLLLKIMF